MVPFFHGLFYSFITRTVKRLPEDHLRFLGVITHANRIQWILVLGWLSFWFSQLPNIDRGCQMPFVEWKELWMLYMVDTAFTSELQGLPSWLNNWWKLSLLVWLSQFPSYFEIISYSFQKVQQCRKAVFGITALSSLYWWIPAISSRTDFHLLLFKFHIWESCR